MKTVNLLRRLEALENQLTGEQIVLLMPDGRIETIPSRGEYMLNLSTRACAGERTREMELIAESVSSTEPGGAHMIDLVRALLNSPRIDSPSRGVRA
jgi:hypothetical protein